LAFFDNAIPLATPFALALPPRSNASA